MKILHIIPSLSPTLGGPTQVALNLVSALRECGNDAEILTTNDDGFRLLDVPLNQRVDYSFDSNSNASVPVWFLPRFSPPLKEFIFSSALACWMWKHLHNYDILDNHYLFSFAPSCAAKIAQQKGIPYTVRTMGQLSPWALAQSRLKKQIYTSLIERYNLKYAAAIHCTSVTEAEDVRKFGIQNPTITLPLGVNPPITIPDASAELHQQYNIPADVPIVLFLSRLHYKKRPELLLQSLNQLSVRGYDFHVILAGSGDSDYLDKLKSLTISLGIAHRVSFPGFVAGREKDLLLQGSDLFVLPSFSENFGIAVAEALVAGLPVVITPDIQIAPEIADAQAGLVVQGEVVPLAAAIAQLLTSPKLRYELSQNAKRLARARYSWKAIAQNLASAYTTIASGIPLLNDTRFDDSANTCPSNINPESSSLKTFLPPNALQPTTSEPLWSTKTTLLN